MEQQDIVKGDGACTSSWWEPARCCCEVCERESEAVDSPCKSCVHDGTMDPC